LHTLPAELLRVVLFMRVLFSQLPPFPEGVTATYSVADRFKACFSSSAKQALAQKVAACWNTALSQIEPRTPAEAQYCPLLSRARVVEKHWLIQQHKGLPEVCELGQRILAGRLGISYEHLTGTEGLEQFARKTFLANYLARYEEGLDINEQNQVCIKYAGGMTEWSQLPEDHRDHTNADFDWRYDHSGITLRSTFDWDEDKLQPIFVNQESIRNLEAPLVHLCTTSGAEPKIISGDHTWLELAEPSTGNMYAVGLFRPDKRGQFDWLKSPLKTKPGKIRTDYAEFWGMPITRCTFTATPEQLQNLKADIESDHKKECVPFNLHKHNCTTWAVSKVNAHLPEANVRAEVPVLRLLTSASVYRVLIKIAAFIPGFIKTIFEAIGSMLMYLLHLTLGSYKKDPAISAEDSVCLKRSLSYLETHSPYAVYNQAQSPSRAVP